MPVVMMNVMSRTFTGKAGVLLLDTEPTSLRTLLLVRDADGRPFDTSSRIEFDRCNPFSWTHQFLTLKGTFYDVGRPEGDVRVIPSYAEYLVAEYLAENPEKKKIGCALLAVPGDDQHLAEFSHEGDVIIMSVEGEPKVRHRVVGGRIVGLEWDDYIATVTDDKDDLLAELWPLAKRRAAEFLAEANGRRY